jgi:chemotaxis protein methyltransferase CheR
MLFAEDEAAWRGWTIDILGTDVSGTVVDRARAGTYTQFEVQRGLGIGQTIKWFEESEEGWRVVEGLRRRTRFQVHNILEAPPHPGEFDIVLCRNVLLYLNAEKRRAAFDRLASAMAPDAWLMLGAGETVIGQTKRLKSDPQARGLYRLTDASEPSDRRTGADRRSAARA